MSTRALNLLDPPVQGARDHFGRPPENTSLTARLSSVADRSFYSIYSFWNPPQLCPPRELVPKHLEKEFFEASTRAPYYMSGERRSYEMEKASLINSGQTPGSNPVLQCAFKNLSKYADPEFREQQARAEFEKILAGQGIAQLRDPQLWSTLTFCDEELSRLYIAEYGQKIAEQERDDMIWFHQHLLFLDAQDDQRSLVKHKRTWDNMSLFEKLKNACTPILIKSLKITVVVASVFFFLNLTVI